MHRVASWHETFVHAGSTESKLRACLCRTILTDLGSAFVSKSLENDVPRVGPCLGHKIQPLLYCLAQNLRQGIQYHAAGA
jgi:hypothetical protein